MVAAARIADNVSDGYRHVMPYLPALLAEDAAAQVLIVGAASEPAVFTNSVGLYAGQVARALGARNVALVDVRRPVRDRAEQLGLVAVAPDEVRGVNEAWLMRRPACWCWFRCRARWLACGDAAAARCRRALRPRWPWLTR
jgi:hypothetical protein